MYDAPELPNKTFTALVSITNNNKTQITVGYEYKCQLIAKYLFCTLDVYFPQ